MGVKRIVDTDFWKDAKVIDYYTPEDKLFWLYLLTNPQSKQLGIYKLPKRLISFELGLDLAKIEELINRFQNKYGVIIYSDDTQEVAILNYLKYSIIKGGKPVIDCIAKDITQIKNLSLLKHVYDRLSNITDNRDTMVAIIEMLSAYDNENDNDIYNDNDSNVPRIVNDSYHDTIEQEEKPIKSIKLSTTLETIMDAWNDLGLQELKTIKPNTIRHNLLNARLKEYSEADILQAIENIKSSNFLQGQNDRGWVITFDWFIKPNNFIKVLENNYKTEIPKPTANKPSRVTKFHTSESRTSKYSAADLDAVAERKRAQAKARAEGVEK